MFVQSMNKNWIHIYGQQLHTANQRPFKVHFTGNSCHWFRTESTCVPTYVCMHVQASRGNKLNYPQKCQSANSRAIPPYSPTERPIVLGKQGTHSCRQTRSRNHPIHDWLKPVHMHTCLHTRSCGQPRSRNHPIHDWLKQVHMLHSILTIYSLTQMDVRTYVCTYVGM